MSKGKSPFHKSWAQWEDFFFSFPVVLKKRGVFDEREFDYGPRLSFYPVVIFFFSHKILSPDVILVGLLGSKHQLTNKNPKFSPAIIWCVSSHSKLHQHMLQDKMRFTWHLLNWGVLEYILMFLQRTFLISCKWMKLPIVRRWLCLLLTVVSWTLV